MKRISFVLLFAMLIPLFSAAGQSISVPGGALSLTFATPNYRLESQPDGRWSLHVPQAALSAEAGYPQLPVYTRLVAVPPQGAVHLVVVRAQGQPLKGHYALPIAPQPAPLQEDLQPGAWRAAPSRLSNGQVYPAAVARIAGEAWVRNQRLVRVEVFPFQYRDGRLIWYPQVEIRLEFEAGAAAPRGGQTPAVSGSPLEASLAAQVSNYEQGKAWRGAGSPIRAAQPLITSSAYRIPITQDGLYRLTYADLQAAGMPVDTVNPADFRMSNQGRDVAYAFEGDSDALFEPGESILFYGQKFRGDYLASLHASDMANWLTLCPACNLKGMFEKYTDENVYWLYTDGGGTRMSTLDAAPHDTASTPTWYPATTHAEENHYWYSHHFSSEATWFWTREQLGYSTSTQTFTTTLSNLAVGAPFSATLRAAVVSRAENVTHHTTFLLNGHNAYESYWPGKTGHTFAQAIPSAWLLEGQNDLDFVVDASTFVDDMYFDWFEVTYPRQFVAQNGMLLFAYPYTGRWQFRVEGLTSSTLYALDVSDPMAPVRLLNPRLSASAGGYQAEFEADSAAEGQFLLVEDAAIRTPAVSRYDPAALTPPSGGADYLFITHHTLLSSTQELAAYRAAQGLSTFVVDVDDVYNQYGYGIYHPVAIRDYLANALSTWTRPPTYVLLVGEGNWNFKRYDSSYGTEPILMPPNLAFVDPWQGEVDATNLLAAVIGDDILPDVAIGRLLVSSPAEFDTVFQKIVDFESAPVQPWQNRATFVADNIPDAAGNFEALTESVINGHIPAGVSVQRIYESSYCGAPTSPPTPCPAVNHAITTTINTTGTLFLNYVGHASVNRWAHEQIFVNNNVADLTNRQQLPVVLSMTCLDGFWLFPNAYLPSLQELMLRSANGGAVGSFSPTGLGVATGHDYLNRGFYDAVYQENATLGAASIAAKLNLYAAGYSFDLIETFTVFGDPALRFPQALTLEDSRQQSGLPGESLRYRLWARNTSTLTQTLTLALSGADWPSTPLSQSTAALAPGAGQALTVTVNIPLQAAPPQSDVLTATLSADSSGATLGSVTLTSLVSTSRGVLLSPANSLRTGLPGDTLAHTFTVTNTGNITETFDLALSGNTWPVNAPGSIGPLPPSASQMFTLSVDIPPSALDSAQDGGLLVLTSQADSTVQAQATFTSTVDLPGGVTLASDAGTRSALPGSVVTYTLTLTNSGLYTDTYDLVAGTSAWNATLSAASIGALSPGAAATFTARVEIPSNAADEESDVLPITAVSQTEPAVQTTLNLTTYARWHHLYLPIVIR